MKSVRQNSIILLFALLCFSNLHAQDSFRSGEIVTNSGDTIKGLINLKSKLASECQFKTQYNSQIRTYKPQEIKAFSIGLQKFTRANLPIASGDVFLEVICQGKVNLYYLNDKIASYFIQKTGETAIHSLPYTQQERYVDNGYTKLLKTVGTTFHIDTLKMVMADKPELFSVIEKIQSPNKKNLTVLVKQYNSTTSEHSKNTSDTKSAFSPKLIKAGKISLYSQTDTKKEEHFYIQKGNGTRLIALPFVKKENKTIQNISIQSYSDFTTNHIDTLKKYMADAMPLYASIDEIKTPSKTKLLKLLAEYNSYTDEASYAKKHALKRLPFNINVTPGLCFGFNNPENEAYRFGSFIHVGFKNSNENYFLKTGLFIYKNNTPLTDLYYVSTAFGVPYYPAVTTCKIPLQFEYRLSGKIIQPCLSVGYNYILFNEKAPYNKSLLPVITPGINFLFSKRCAVHLNMELEFKNKNANQMYYLPTAFKRGSLFLGLQVKI